jgi:hypothetical protein
MCLLIFSPDIKKSKIDIDDLKRGFTKNNDGAGLAYVLDGKVVIDKGYFKFKSFLHAYERITRTIEGPLMIHFRMATSGKKDYQNSHPMSIYDGELCMGHNGVFTELSYSNSETSDTVKLAELLNSLQWNFPFAPEQEKILTMLCGSYNKLVFLDNNGKYLIINEKQGTWRDDTWYSNTGAFEYKPSYTPAHVHMGSMYDHDWENEYADAEAEAFLCPKDSEPIPLILKNIKDEDMADQDKVIARYMDKYPNLFALSFKAKIKARIEAKSKIVSMPPALPALPAPGQTLLPGVADEAKKQAAAVGASIPLNDPTSIYFRGGS